jgi:SseB protein N-terminal domain
MGLMDRLFGKKATDVPAKSSATAIPDLKSAMTLVAESDNRENRKKLYETFLKSDLYLLIPEVNNPGERVAKGGESFQIVGLNDKEGRPSWPAFTDEAEITKWRPEGSPYIRIAARAAFQMMLQGNVQRIYINPGTIPTGFLSRQEVELLATGIIPGGVENNMSRMTVTESTKILIGSPAKEPLDQMLQAMRLELAHFPFVQQGFYLWERSAPESLT